MTKIPLMTPRQIELARHALGLPNDYKKSYRNRFIAGKDHPDHKDWMEMVEKGFATVIKDCEHFGGSDFFKLTMVGAASIAKSSESLCKEDFPND